MNLKNITMNCLDEIYVCNPTNPCTPDNECGPLVGAPSCGPDCDSGNCGPDYGDCLPD